MRQKASLEKNKRKEIVEDLTSLTIQMQKIVNEDMAQCYSELAAAWQGEAADLFIQKGENQRKHMEALTRKIKKTTNCIEEWEESR